MVRRAAEETAMDLGPRFECVPAFDKVLVTGWQLPDAIGSNGAAAAMIVAGFAFCDLERHKLEVLRCALEIVKFSDRSDNVPKSGMLGNIRHQRSIDEQFATII